MSWIVLIKDSISICIFINLLHTYIVLFLSYNPIQYNFDLYQMILSWYLPNFIYGYRIVD